MTWSRMAIALAWVALLPAPATAQTYPSKPITIVVSLAAGGAADVIARALAQRLTDDWGQPVLVENKAAPTTRSAPPQSHVRRRTATRCC